MEINTANILNTYIRDFTHTLTLNAYYQSKVIHIRKCNARENEEEPSTHQSPAVIFQLIN